MNIRNEIVEARRARLRREGHAQGWEGLPQNRSVPLVPFGREPFVICEIKRRSPSKGSIDEGLDPLLLAKSYSAGGAVCFSVLTEEKYFKGSLLDLVSVKSALPGAAVLRKDFLLDEEDIDVSYRAGADAVLLIASVLDTKRLASLYVHAKSYGMEVLVEVHGKEDVEKVRGFRPGLVGINARNLETFEVDLLRPAAVRSLIDWESRVVFESGIAGGPDASFAGSLGFSGILVGEAAVRNPEIVPEIIRGFESGRAQAAAAPPSRNFWNEIAVRGSVKRPLVKICGLTNWEDASLADDLGADVLGFVFADSPRRADPADVARMKKTHALKVGVVVEGRAGIPEDVTRLLAENKLDALQIHRSEGGPMAAPCPFSFYTALRPRDAAEAAAVGSLPPAPRVLLDAFSSSAQGGTGRRIGDEILSAANRGPALWLAGGLGPDNIRAVVEKWNPELIDASSGLEDYPGKKSAAKLARYFKEAGCGRS